MASIFSTYKQRENRVTSTLTALLRTLSIDQAQMLIGMLLGDPDLELVTIKNQSSHKSSVPDAELSGNFKILIETKVEVNAVDKEQLRNHVGVLPKDLISQGKAGLILLTPDAQIPEQVPKDLPITWLNFDDLVQALGELEKMSFLPEKDRFLLAQFCSYLEEEGLLKSMDQSKDRVLVIPARMAWKEYEESNSYICQDKRTFQPSSRLAFYKEGEIMPQVPAILTVFDSVYFPDTQEEFDPRNYILPSDNEDLDETKRKHLANTVAYWSKKRNEYGKCFKVFLLSPYIKESEKVKKNDEHNGTWLLPEAVKHEPKGRGTAYVQNQRYVGFESLKKATTTYDLEDAKGM